MGWKSSLLKPVAAWIGRKVARDARQALSDQDAWRERLVSKARATRYGKDHNFTAIRNHEDFKQRVPVFDYEGIKDYIERIKQGERDVLWPGRPRYFAKTSGTTSGVKYIPITTDSTPNHFGTARNTVFNYFHLTGKGDYFDGKVMFLSGSPVLEALGDVLVGRLSGISNHMVPAWLKGNQLPSYPTNCIEDWEWKVSKIVEETHHQDLRLLGGIPPWVQMYYEKLLEYTGKSSVMEIFPHLSMFVYGGVNYEPYRSKLEHLLGSSVPSLETYPASEGFIAFQDTPAFEGLLLNTNSGIFFEFIPVEHYFDPQPPRLGLREVELGRQYAIVLNSNAGLWGYSIGDTVEFVSLTPYRIIVSGRIKHFISAFGEHVIGKEVECAMLEALDQCGGSLVEFTVAPAVNPEEGGLPYHEWWISFAAMPRDLEAFALALDLAMQKQNVYYRDLIEGKILRPLVLRCLEEDAFRQYMKSQGKLGGQNKVPRLSNDRKIAQALSPYLKRD
jgi:hypothetical protein